MISPRIFRTAAALSSFLYLSSAGIAGADTYSDALKSRLTAETNSLSELSEARRKHIATFYKQRNYRPVWIGESGLNTRARRLFGAFKFADRDAMVPDDYRSLLLNSDWTLSPGVQQTPENLAKLETDITLAAMLYGRHATAGRVDPGKVNSSVKLKPVAEPIDSILHGISSTLRPERYLTGLLPKHEQYLRLKKKYAQYVETTETEDIQPPAKWPHIAMRGVIGYGMQARAVILLKQRLLGPEADQLRPSQDVALGTSTRNYSKVFDLELHKAVKAFQKRNNLWPDGLVGPTTLRKLNGSSTAPAKPSLKAKEQIALNMERYRWLPDNLGERHVLVNQPEYKLRVFDKGEIIHQARVIVGKRRHATPVFSDQMSLVVFNPNWNVPRSIATKEILPRLQRDPYYLQRHNMTLFRGYTSKRVNPTRIDWRNVSRKSFPYRIRQRPGSRNALGRIKFLFPNKHSIYLHDTPGKSLFKKSARAFSHGCVRVQNPQLLAEILLSRDKGWSLGKIRKSINSGRRRIVKLSKKVPIHLAYFTTWVDNQGKITFLDDIYGRDKKLNIVLNQIRIAMK